MIIGLSGKIGSGKDEVARRLCLTRDFAIARFSERLKAEVVERLPRTLTAIYRATYAVQPWAIDPGPADLRHMVYVDKPKIVREILQEWGTELRRAEDPDYWIKAWGKLVADLNHPRIVVPDVRFPNEATAVLAAGGQCWLITRPGQPGTGSHASEHGLDGFDGYTCQLANTGSLEDLYALVDETAALLCP